MDISQPIARTAFYCCVIRADDAASTHPLCGDTFAGRFVDDAVRRDLAPLLSLGAPADSNVARHRLIDDELRERLASNPDRRIIVLGAGFDTRPFRLVGGRWTELDDPPLLAFKEQRLPAHLLRSASGPHRADLLGGGDVEFMSGEFVNVTFKLHELLAKIVAHVA